VQSVQKFVTAITNAWNAQNTIPSVFLETNQIRIETVENSKKNYQRAIDVSTSGLQQVVFNIYIENPNAGTQIDSTDLLEPTNETYFTKLQEQFPNIQLTDLLAVELTTTTTTTTTTKAPTTAVSQDKTTSPLASSKSLVSKNLQNIKSGLYL
jgi:hypothetical protein